MIRAWQQVHNQYADQTLISYDGLGAVVAREQGNQYGSNVEEFRNDAFGNVLRRLSRRSAGGINDAPFLNTYGFKGELTSSFAQLNSPPSGIYQRQDEMSQTFQNGRMIKQGEVVRNPSTGDVETQIAERPYYGSDDRLMVVEKYSWHPTLRDGTWEEYRYDALGRRVMTRVRRDPTPIYDASVSGPLCQSSDTPVCRSFIERVTWDGDQALFEFRFAEGTSDVSNNGVMGNVHALTLDEPLAVISHWTNETRIINYNWRGQALSSVFPTGEGSDASTSSTNATEIEWPAASQAQTYFTPALGLTPDNTPKLWLGTFVQSGQSTAGMLYRRNRYFDTNTGRFTQEDPLGIAGGLNVYGFANGDPVNYSDPFGLSPCCVLEEGAQNAVFEAIRINQIETEAMLEYARERAENMTLLIMGGVEAAWGIARAGAGIARNLPQAENLTEQVAFKSMLSEPGLEIARGEAFRDAGRVARTYGGRTAEWAKMKSISKWTDRMGRQFETHWIENLKTGVKVEAKFKLISEHVR